MSASEKVALLPSNASGSGPSYYFVQSDSVAKEGSRTDADGGQVVETIPEGASPEEFSSRPVNTPRAGRRKQGIPTTSSHSDRSNGTSSTSGPVGFFRRLFGYHDNTPTNTGSRPYGEVGTLVRERKVPVKVEPKVFFANERTFLAWMHCAILLAGASVAIVAFAESNPWSQLYGIILLPVAIAFIVYAMYQYARRAAMIRRKDPGPYEDTVGPTVLGIMLMLSIVFNFCIKLYSMSQ